MRNLLAATIAISVGGISIQAFAPELPSHPINLKHCGRVTVPPALARGTVHNKFTLTTQADATEGERIVKILVNGIKSLSAKALIEMSGHKVGDRCISAVLSEIRDKLAMSGNFGMHYPDHQEKWVQVQAEDIGNHDCLVTISVDENDTISNVTITDSGPIKSQEIRPLITSAGIFNATTLERDKRTIVGHYNVHGYSASFGKSLGMDPVKTGVLTIPIIVDRVGKIEIRKDNVKSIDPVVFDRITTKQGGYFSRKTFYEQDRKKLIDTGDYDDVNFSERAESPGVINLDISLKLKK